ncbi:hypothetical protein HT118_21510 [Escherichia coli]|nr:hypothetical protein [Escherichia coli]
MSKACQKVNQTLKNKKKIGYNLRVYVGGIKKAEEIRLILLTKCTLSMPDAARTPYPAYKKFANSINCRIHVGLISEAHQAFLLLSSVSG